jgi:hypothetical protein
VRHVNVVLVCPQPGREANLSIKVLAENHWSAAQVESVARAQTHSYDDFICFIRELDYYHNPKGNVMPVNYIDADGAEHIPSENQALWCEIKDHAFSAKDTDKMFVRQRGESKLGCGPCTRVIFQSPESAAISEGTKA